MQIRYEYLSESYPRFGVYKIQEGETIQQYFLHDNFVEIIDKSLDYPRHKHVFLLDESRFSFFRFDIFLETQENFSIQDIRKITNEKTREIENGEGSPSKFLATYVDSIFVNGEEKSHIIGEFGAIFFRLYIIYIELKSFNHLKAAYGDITDNKNLKILPQSFHSTLFIRNNLKRENFMILYISESSAKIIKISNSFYESVNVINLGINSLKQMYKDNGIAQYWNKSYEEIQNNNLAETIVHDTLEFYSTLFFAWMEEQNCIGSDIFLISPIVKNGHFMEIFNRKYREYTDNYIVPFHYSDKLDNFGREREPQDMDTLIFLNRENWK